jgi:hypothetical protein
MTLTDTSATGRTSWLDSAGSSLWANEPFFTHTVELLRGVRDHDFDSLAALCDDDFGIVDLDQSGSNVMVRTREDWEARFTRLFGELDAAAAATDSEIVSYRAIEGVELGFGVVEFRQFLTVAGHVAAFDCVATIVWKLTPEGWREARWHVSLLTSEVPEALAAMTGGAA